MIDDQVIIIIPARFASTRFPGKPLHPLAGPSGEAKPLIRWTWETARAVPGVDAVYVATDSDEIARVATGFGAEVVMTSPDCRNGTERCADALRRLGGRPRLVVNVQGDAPLTPGYAVAALIEAAGSGGSSGDRAAVHTPALRCSLEQFERLEADARRGIVGATTVACTASGRALYFSKQMIPYQPLDRRQHRVGTLLHMGIYAYTPAALDAYVDHPETKLERLEGLEQLRFLEFGAHVQVVPVDPPAWDIWELNNPADVAIVERGLARMLQS
jgi:3-deoxy-manno-octulosonate cytidylyltransferase (CMP-KDO synthetase)